MDIALLVLAVVVAAICAVVGSFLAVFILRSERDEQWLVGRSHCDNCQYQLAWYDNIPLFSFLWLNGQCRRCHKPIDKLHFWVEISAALVGFLLTLSAGQLSFISWPVLILELLVALALIGIFWADYQYFIIPDELNIFLAVLLVASRLYQGFSGQISWQELGVILAGTAILILFFFSLWFFTKGQGFGFGDVKFAFVLGLWLGWPRLIIGVFLAFILGSLVSLWLIIFRQKKLRQQVPFGPFLIIGGAIAWFYGAELFAWYINLL